MTVTTHLYMDLLEDGFKHRDCQPWGQGHTQALGRKCEHRGKSGNFGVAFKLKRAYLTAVGITASEHHGRDSIRPFKARPFSPSD